MTQYADKGPLGIQRKECKKCKKQRLLDSFPIRNCKNGKTYYNSYCKACYIKRGRANGHIPRTIFMKNLSDIMKARHKYNEKLEFEDIDEIPGLEDLEE